MPLQAVTHAPGGVCSCASNEAKEEKEAKAGSFMVKECDPKEEEKGRKIQAVKQKDILLRGSIPMTDRTFCAP